MSEPSSFFLRAHITEERLEQFMSAASTNISDYGDWQAWFDAEQRMYGDAKEMLSDLAHCNKGSSRENVYAEHINYDKTTQCVTMDHIFLSESFSDFLPLVSCLRGMEKYITPETQNNFLVIYPYWWEAGNEVNIGIEFADNESHITAVLQEENKAIADAFFDEHAEALAKELYNKQGYI